MQVVKEQYKISYAEAVKKVDAQAQIPVKAHQKESVGTKELRRSTNQDLMTVSKESLLAFIVDVVYESRTKFSRNDLTKCVVESAVKFLGLKDYAPQSLLQYMKAGQELSQSSIEDDGASRGEEETWSVKDGDLIDMLENV